MSRHRALTGLVERWRSDLRENFDGPLKDPLAQGPGRRWDRDFGGEVGRNDVHYGIFIVGLSLIPAAIVAYVSTGPRVQVLAQLFGAPLHAVIAGFLTASLVFLGAHVNRAPRPWPVAFKLMLRIMAMHPLFAFLLLSRFGAVMALLFHGFFVVRGVRKTYAVTVQNSLLFFGVIYVVFALFQFQSLLKPVSESRLPGLLGHPPLSIPAEPLDQ